MRIGIEGKRKFPLHAGAQVLQFRQRAGLGALFGK